MFSVFSEWDKQKNKERSVVVRREDHPKTFKVAVNNDCEVTCDGGQRGPNSACESLQNQAKGRGPAAIINAFHAGAESKQHEDEDKVEKWFWESLKPEFF